MPRTTEILKNKVPALAILLAITTIGVYQTRNLFKMVGLWFTGQDGVTASLPEEGVVGSGVPISIRIPALDLVLPVHSQPLTGDTWPVSSGTANYAQQTSLLNREGGNVLIYAHNTPALFGRLGELEKEDLVFVTDGAFTYQYAIAEKIKVVPSDVSVVREFSRPTLTLLTCEGIFAHKRLVIRANYIRRYPYQPVSF